jgi:hypothetical protein
MLNQFPEERRDEVLMVVGGALIVASLTLAYSLLMI